ncbi:MAG: tetratricopeptide repeat protein [Anaerolineae bacterium]|nr:tetratricopeptide repeat protein [Anaerolineae bacterium]
MLNGLSRTRKIIFVITILLIVAAVVVIAIATYVGKTSPFSNEFTTTLLVVTTLVLTAIPVVPALRDILHPEVKHSDQEISNALSELAQAKTFLEQHEYQKAIQATNRVIGILPKKSDAYFIRGKAFQNLGQLSSAVTDFTRTIELEPGHPFVYSNRGRVYEDMGEYYLAIEDYRMTLAIAPEISSAIFQLAHLYFRIGAFEKANEMFKAVITHPKTSKNEKEMSAEFIERANNILEHKK